MFTTKKEIKHWLITNNVKHYTINNDLTIDVLGDVYLFGKGLTAIPVQFNNVSGDFYCHKNNLTSLKG